MPELGGIDRSIKHAELPRFELLHGGQRRIANPFAGQGRVSVDELVRRMKEDQDFLDKNLTAILEYFKNEQFLVSAAIDELARAINERSLDLGLYFFLDNVGANLTNQALSNGMSTRGFAAEDYGSVTSIVAKLNDARTGGTLTVEATINGVATGLTVLIDGTNTTSMVGRQDPGTDTFAEGDNIGAIVTTVGFAPTTADLDVTVGLRYSGRTR